MCSFFNFYLYGGEGEGEKSNELYEQHFTKHKSCEIACPHETWSKAAPFSGPEQLQIGEGGRGLDKRSPGPIGRLGSRILNTIRRMEGEIRICSFYSHLSLHTKLRCFYNAVWMAVILTPGPACFICRPQSSKSVPGVLFQIENRQQVIQHTNKIGATFPIFGMRLEHGFGFRSFTFRRPSPMSPGLGDGFTLATAA